jgi:hypothetical protein
MGWGYKSKMKPYIVFFTYDDHGFETMKPVFDLFSKSDNFDATLLLAANLGHGRFEDPHVKAEKRLGLQGKKFGLSRISFARKPSVVIGFRLWWDPDLHPAVAARRQGIPVVMMNHGAMFVHNNAQTYKRTLGPAVVNCIWGQHDKKCWGRWNQNESQFVITGNPLHDCIVDYKCPDIDVPDEFALLLTPRGQRKYINPSAEALNKIMPVVAKTHPIDLEKGYYKERYQTFTAAETLLPLLYKCKLILTNVSSAWIPALYWQKPVFIHSFETKGYHFNAFKDMYPGHLNFKQESDWSEDIINNAIVPTVDTYRIFGHEPDGKNARRVAEVILRYV